jgi:competence protein ComEC
VNSFKIKTIFLAAVFFSAFCFYSLWQWYLLVPRELEVDFLDVGQGDSILIKSQAGNNILIDGGPGSKVLEGLGRHLPWWDRSIDLVIMTHSHDDHLQGLLAVARNYHIAKAVISDEPTTALLEEWKKILRTEAVPIQIIDDRLTVKLNGGIELAIIKPNIKVSNSNRVNELSLIEQLRYGSTTMIMMADAGVYAEKFLGQSSSSITADLLKIGHHGSDLSSSETFLQRVAPDLAVISVGAGNKFGHPNRRIIKRLERLGIPYRRTDQFGDIVVHDDGHRLAID